MFTSSSPYHTRYKPFYIFIYSHRKVITGSNFVEFSHSSGANLALKYASVLCIVHVL